MRPSIRHVVSNKRCPYEGTHNDRNATLQSVSELENALLPQLDYRALVWAKPVAVDESMLELIEQAKLHCERIDDPSNWLDAEGFSRNHTMKMPEPFHGFRKVYGADSSSTSSRASEGAASE